MSGRILAAFFNTFSQIREKRSRGYSNKIGAPKLAAMNFALKKARPNSLGSFLRRSQRVKRAHPAFVVSLKLLVAQDLQIEIKRIGRELFSTFDLENFLLGEPQARPVPQLFFHPFETVFSPVRLCKEHGYDGA